MEQKEMLEFYEIAVKDCHARGINRYEAKKESREKVYAAYPELVVTGISPVNDKMASDFWRRAVHIVCKYYGKKKPMPISNPLDYLIAPPQKPQNKLAENFSDIMRAAAETGFIPFGEYLAPFINGKHAQIQAYVSMLRREGYECKIIQHGWAVTKTETESQRIARENAERARIEAERLAAQRKEIEAQIESAKARASAEIEALFLKLAAAK